MVGFSDLEIVAHGKIAYIEVKSPTGKLTTLQQRFLNDRKAHGAKTAVVRSVDELIKFLETEMSVATGFFAFKRHRPGRDGNICGLLDDKRDRQFNPQ